MARTSSYYTTSTASFSIGSGSIGPAEPVPICSKCGRIIKEYDVKNGTYKCLYCNVDITKELKDWKEVLK